MVMIRASEPPGNRRRASFRDLGTVISSLGLLSIAFSFT
jgi:hypothetical protein